MIKFELQETQLAADQTMHLLRYAAAEATGTIKLVRCTAHMVAYPLLDSSCGDSQARGKSLPNPMMRGDETRYCGSYSADQWMRSQYWTSCANLIWKLSMYN